MKEKRAGALTLLLTVTYVVSYLTRTNYAAIISEMELSTGFSRSLLSLSLTGSFITYGVGQVLSGILGDRIQPKKMILLGLLLSAGMNALLPLCQSPTQMTVLWCVNGFAQACLWPPLVRLMVALFTAEEYKKYSVIVSMGGSIGTILVYLASPMLILTLGWKSVFWTASVCGIVMALVWCKLPCHIEKKQPEKEAVSKQDGTNRHTALLALILLAIVLQGALRDGVTTWMPTYILETYHLESSTSILTGVLLPIFGVVCIQAASVLYRKVLKNPILCASAIFALGFAASVGLLLLSGKSMTGALVAGAVLAGCMHGVNLMLITMLPPYLQRGGNISTISGILNSATYVGSALSTYGLAVLSDALGWQASLLSWAVIAGLGTLLCAVCVPAWKKLQSLESSSNTN